MLFEIIGADLEENPDQNIFFWYLQISYCDINSVSLSFTILYLK